MVGELVLFSIANVQGEIHPPDVLVKSGFLSPRGPARFKQMYGFGWIAFLWVGMSRLQKAAFGPETTGH
ncbi:hypothetical protein R69608_04458 [Paraburkholderia nemoris]|nr:hypothetical protein R69608_04458 [Paraburkholderia nemoris]